MRGSWQLFTVAVLSCLRFGKSGPPLVPSSQKCVFVTSEALVLFVPESPAGIGEFLLNNIFKNNSFNPVEKRNFYPKRLS